jgi:hypothetical protein
MKKHILLLFAAMLLPMAINAQSVDVYIIDNDGPVTNIRNAPRGKVVTTLPTDQALVVTLLSAKGEWWKIDDVVEQYGDEEKEIELKGSKSGYWIHRSLLQFTIAGDPDGALRAAPSAKAKAIKFSTNEGFHPIAIKGNWVKAVSIDGKYTGWIHCDRICSNPLTTCP